MRLLSTRSIPFVIAQILMTVGVGTVVSNVGAQSERPPATGMESRIAALEAQVRSLEDRLTHVSRTGDDLYITGANLHVLSGAGATSETNGRGNVIIGYNETRGAVCPEPVDPSDPTCDARTGSHILVVGSQLNYTGFGGIVSGLWNTSAGAFASVTGGNDNTASGFASSVTGGKKNTANGPSSSVTGGQFNTASSLIGGATVSGGSDNLASGPSSSVTGGYGNTASGEFASVTGGQFNNATDRR